MLGYQRLCKLVLTESHEHVLVILRPSPGIVLGIKVGQPLVASKLCGRFHYILQNSQACLEGEFRGQLGRHQPHGINRQPYPGIGASPGYFLPPRTPDFGARSALAIKGNCLSGYLEQWMVEAAFSSSRILGRTMIFQFALNCYISNMNQLLVSPPQKPSISKIS